MSYASVSFDYFFWCFFPWLFSSNLRCFWGKVFLYRNNAHLVCFFFILTQRSLNSVKLTLTDDYCQWTSSEPKLVVTKSAILFTPEKIGDLNLFLESFVNVNPVKKLQSKKEHSYRIGRRWTVNLAWPELHEYENSWSVEEEKACCVTMCKLGSLLQICNVNDNMSEMCIRHGDLHTDTNTHIHTRAQLLQCVTHLVFHPFSSSWE